MVEFWTSTRSLPDVAVDAAVRAEAAGWDGMTFTDSQNRSGDPYVAMTAAVLRTDDLKVATGVTNPLTRHPAVTAGAALCVHHLSGSGRVEIGIGRGDSSLAHLGLAPAPPAAFREYLEDLHTYINGGAISLERASRGATHTIDDLPLASTPEDSRIRYIETSGIPKPYPQVFITGSGPKVIEIGANTVDRVALAVGASPERVSWGAQLARDANPEIDLAAYVVMVVDDDFAAAKKLAGGSVTSFARFSVMHGTASGPSSDAARGVFESIPRQYDMAKHFTSDNEANELPDEFVREYAILGSADYCVERLHELVELGISRFHVIGASFDVDPADAQRAEGRLADEVLPRARQLAVS